MLRIVSQGDLIFLIYINSKLSTHLVNLCHFYDTRRCKSIKQINSISLMLLREMGIAHCHGYVLMTKQLLNILQTTTL